MMNTAEKLERARFAVLRDQPFFGAILLHYYNAFTASFETETLATNARQIIYNPTWVAKVFEPHLQTYLAKIAMHIACEHPLRLGKRDIGLANLAMALAVNPMLRDAGFDLPPDAPLDPQFDNMTWEQIYDILAQRRDSSFDQDRADQPDQSGVSDGSGQPPCGPSDNHADQADDGRPDGHKVQPSVPGGADVCPMLEEDGAPALPETVRDAEAQNRIRLVQARQAARRAGKLGSNVDRLVQALIQPTVSWADFLRRFIRDQAREGYSWSRPDRRHAWRGVILPSRHSQTLGEIVVAVDTSASFGDDELAIATTEAAAIFNEVRPKAVTVIYCDAKVTRTERFETFDHFELHATGGGGTRFQPVFDWVEDNLTSAPACLIYFTDMQPFDEPNEPGYPVLWAATGDDHKDLGFGEKLPLGWTSNLDPLGWRLHSRNHGS